MYTYILCSYMCTHIHIAYMYVHIYIYVSMYRIKFYNLILNLTICLGQHFMSVDSIMYYNTSNHFPV